MAEYGLKFTPTEKEVTRLFNYLFEIWTDLSRLEKELGINNSLKNFPKYQKLMEVNENLGRYVDQLLNKYSKDVRGLVKAKDWLEHVYDLLKGDVYIVAGEVEHYSNSLFRKHVQDNVTAQLKECEDLNEDIKASLGILRKLYKMHDVEPELIEKSKKLKPALNVETKAFVLLLVLTLSFASLRILSATNITTTTGFISLPTGEIAGINFEMLYIITSSMILGIYILGKLMKKW